MAITVVQTASGSGSSCTFASPVTAGNCIVVGWGDENTSVTAISGVTIGGAADNFAQLIFTSGTPSAKMVATLWADPNCAGGGTSVAVTPTGTVQSPCIWAIEVSGLASASILDKSTGMTGIASSWSSGSTATTAQAAELWVGAMSNSGASTAGPASPWVNTSVTDSAGEVFVFGYDIVSSTGTASYAGTGGASKGWAACVATLKGTTNVSVSLPVAQVTAAAPAPGVGAGPVALPVAQVTVTAYPVTPGQAFALPVAQVTMAALPPGIQHGWTLALPVAQENVAALPPSTSVNVSIDLPAAQVTVSAHPPALSRQLLISLASAAGTDDYGNSFPLGIQATAGLIEGPEIVGSDAFFYSSKTLGGLVQSITGADGTDAYGNAYIAGTATYANNGTFWSAVVVDNGVVTWYKATSEAGPWTSEAGIGFSWNSLTGGGLTFTGAAGNDMTGDLTVTGSITATVTLTVNGTDVGATLSNIISALSGASTSTDGLTNGTIAGTSGGASAGTAHTHGPGSFSVNNGQHHHTLPTVP